MRWIQGLAGIGFMHGHRRGSAPVRQLFCRDARGGRRACGQRSFAQAFDVHRKCDQQRQTGDHVPAIRRAVFLFQQFDERHQRAFVRLNVRTRHAGALQQRDERRRDHRGERFERTLRGRQHQTIHVRREVEAEHGLHPSTRTPDDGVALNVRDVVPAASCAD